MVMVAVACYSAAPRVHPFPTGAHNGHSKQRGGRTLNALTMLPPATQANGVVLQAERDVFSLSAIATTRVPPDRLGLMADKATLEKSFGYTMTIEWFGEQPPAS